MKKIILPYLALFAVCLFFAFRKKEVSVILTGQVLAQGVPLYSAKVNVQDQTMPGPYYYEPTSAQGDYRLQFNVTEGKIIQLLYSKRGYASLLRSFATDGSNKLTTMPPVHLLKFDTCEGTNNILSVYKTPEKSIPMEYSISRIPYFLMIEKKYDLINTIRDTTGNKVFRKGAWFQVSFVLEGQKSPVAGWVLEQWWN